MATDPESTATVSAIGKGSGSGGRFSAFHAVTDIDILRFVNVDGGSGVTTSGDFGSITLNNLKCRQWKLAGAQAWPKTHWVCTTRREAPDVIDNAPASVALGAAFDNLRALFADPLHKVNIFVFENANDFNSFYYEGAAGPTGGVTFRIPSAAKNIYANPWLSGSIGGGTISYSSSQVSEVSAHEFGHAFDIIKKSGNPLQLPSVSALYLSYMQRDVNKLDFVDPAFTVPRAPCSNNGTAPFDGIIDVSSGFAICVNGQLNDSVLGLGGSWPLGTFPSQVLGTLDPSLWTGAHWIEPHAQVFGYTAAGNLGARPMTDAIFDKGYFLCVKSWAASERSNVIPTAACTL